MKQKTIDKSILKSGYYYEFEPLYDSLPQKLKVPKYTERILPETMTNEEIMEKYIKKEFTIEEAFAVAADYSEKIKDGEWRIVYFKDENSIPCGLGVWKPTPSKWRNDGGELNLCVYGVTLGLGYDAGRGTLVSDENSESSPRSPLSLERFDSLLARVEKIEKFVEGIKNL